MIGTMSSFAARLARILGHAPGKPLIAITFDNRDYWCRFCFR